MLFWKQIVLPEGWKSNYYVIFVCVHCTINVFMDGVYFDLRKSAILHFWPTPNPIYYTSELLARGFKAARWTPLAAALGLVASALGQQIVLT